MSVEEQKEKCPQLILVQSSISSPTATTISVSSIGEEKEEEVEEEVEKEEEEEAAALMNKRKDL